MHIADLLSPAGIVNSGLCIGCGVCVAQSDSADARMQFDADGLLKPTGVANSERFSSTCPFSPASENEDQLAARMFPDTRDVHPSLGRFQSAYVGYVAENDFRAQGSSGGMVSWVAAELLRKGLVDSVAHVVSSDDPQIHGRFFHYRLSHTEDEIRAGAKSRYYPVELSEILRTIRDTAGRYAVVGIPCFIKAVQLLRMQDELFRNRIRYTLGLFCGHMKSARFIESFACQMNVPLSEIARVDFRHKNPSRPANCYTAQLTLRDGRVVAKDWWHLADGDWGAGFFMNSACNFCDDVIAETADISFGDAWLQPYSSDGRGTNVVVVRSLELEDLLANAIKEGRLKLDAVNAEFVEQTQAAGFRQRREGLAYRLSWKRWKHKPRKRVEPNPQIPRNRKLIYRLRYMISLWSHRIFRAAMRMRTPRLYIRWARLAAAVYHGLAYHRGNLSEIIKRFKGL